MNPHFVSRDDFSKFKEFHISRYLKKRGTEAKTRERLIDTISSQITSLSGRSSLRFNQKAILIKAERDDGSSWACEEIADHLQNKMPHWHICSFTGKRSKHDFPEVVQYIGTKNFLKIINKAKLVNFNLGPSKGRVIFFILLAFVLTFILTILPPVNNFIQNISQNIGSLLVNGLMVLTITVISIFVQIVLNNISLEKESNIAEQVVEALTINKNKRKEYGDVVENIALKFLNLNPPQYVIIDDFSCLDEFTQDVLKKAATTSPSGTGSLFWVIFEIAENSILTNELLTNMQFNKLFCDGNHATLRLDHISLEERTEILKRSGLPLEIAKEQVLVKNLVRGVSNKEIENLRLAWNDIQLELKTGSGISVPDLFRIIALNSHFPPSDLNDHKLLHIFSQKQSLFNSLLSCFYSDKSFFRREEVQKNLSLIRGDKFSRFLLDVTDSEEPLKIKRTTFQVLEDDAGKTLNNNIIHLFWLIYWFRAFQNDFDSTQKLQKLANHASCAAIAPQMFGSNTGKTLCIEFLQILARIANTCLHRTFFKQALKVGASIIRNARILLEEYSTEDLPEFDKLLNNLLEACWKIYVVTNNEAFFNEVLTLFSDIDLQIKEFPQDDIFNKQIHNYLRLCNVPLDIKDIAAKRIEQIASENKALQKRLRDYMLLSVSNFSYYLDRFAENIYIEACSLPTSQEMSDLANATLDYQIYEDLYSEGNRAFSILDYQNLAGFIRNLLRCDQTDKARDLIITFVLKASQFMPSNGTIATSKGPLPENLSLLERALQLESLAVCLDSLIVSVAKDGAEKYDYSTPIGEKKYAFAQNIYPRKNVKKVEDIVNFVYTILGESKSFDWSEKKPIPIAILQKTDDLYMQAAIVWEELGLEEMRYRVFMQRAQFIFNFSDVDPEYRETYEEIFNSLSNFLPSNNLSGLVCHLLIARFLYPLKDLSRFYLCEVTCRILDGNFDDDLKVFFSIISFTVGRLNSQTIKIAKFITPQFEDFNEVRKILLKYDADTLSLLIHRLLVVAHSTNDDQLYFRIRTIGDRLMLTKEFNAKNELKVFLDYHDIQQKISNGVKIDMKDLVSQWEKSKDHWLYSAVLKIAFENNHPDEASIHSGLDYLMTRRTPFGSTAEMHLLHEITGHIINSKLEKHYGRCKKLLLEKVVPILPDWPVENALDTYALLSQVDKIDAPNHLDSHAQWNGIKLDREKIENLGYFIEKGYFWGVFDSYFKALKIYDLPTISVDENFCKKLSEGDINTVLSIIKSDGIEKRFLLSKIVNSQKVILLDFVFLGRLTFSLDVKDDPIIEEFRQRLNAETKNQIGDFFDIVARTDSIPHFLREIIAEHRKEFLL